MVPANKMYLESLPLIPSLPYKKPPRLGLVLVAAVTLGCFTIGIILLAKTPIPATVQLFPKSDSAKSRSQYY